MPTQPSRSTLDEAESSVRRGRATFATALAVCSALSGSAGCSGDSTSGEPSTIGGSGAGGAGGSSGSDGGAGGSAAGAGGGGGSGGSIVLGEPIDVAANEQWTWVPIEGTKCADGTEAGVGVNFTSQSRDLVIFFQGNGVCYDATSCSLFSNLLVGMGPDPLTQMWWGTPWTGSLGVFNRSDAENPLRQSNYIVFPHCGVDGHTADKESNYPPMATIYQHGYRNVTLALSRIVPTFLDATRVVVAGFSAGGIGAGANYHQIAEAFEDVGKPPPYLIDDAGPVVPPPYLGPLAQASLRTGWGLDQTLERWCPDCATEGYHAVHETIARLHPGLRSSVICAYNDGIVTALYTLLNPGDNFDGPRLDAGLRALSAYSSGFLTDHAPSTQHEFYYPGTRHGAIVVANLGATPGLPAFLNAQLNDDPAWATVHQ